jgi:hypothetical protein
MRRFIVIVSFTLLCCLPEEEPLAQFLNREYYPWWDEKYENYGVTSYRDYGGITDQATYDPFGTYILNGIDLMRVESYGTLYPDEGNRMFKNGTWWGQFRNLVVMRDQYRGWSSRVMVGQDVPGKFSDTMLDAATLEGLRWDASTHKNSFSLLASRISEPIANGINTLPFASFLYGGHWQSQLGDILTVGASYVTVHHRDNMQKEGSWRGDVPTDLEPTPSIYVIFNDDSPEDRPGAIIYDVKIFVNGLPGNIQPDIRKIARVTDFVGVSPADIRRGIRRPANFPTAMIPYARRGEAWVPRIGIYDNIFYEKLFGAGDNIFSTQGVPVPAGKPVEVTGTDLVVYRYEVPPNVRGVSFQVLLSGDYSIEVGRSYGLVRTAFVWNDWHNVVRAPGNVRDESNMKWVSFDYRFPVGIMQYSGQMSVSIGGVTVNGEYTKNFAYSQFPAAKGSQGVVKTGAYLVNAMKRTGNWEVGGEFFKMPPAYQTSFKYWSESTPLGGEVLTYELIDDNDDNDDWADNWEHWDPLSTQYDLQSSIFDITASQKDAKDRGYNRLVGYGVYPGLDENGDGILDTNVNQNETPDYAEPFLMYYVEPDNFVYGDDFNHNGVVDVRENDNRPDYPYNLDTEGYHTFVRFQTGGHWKFLSGRYDVRQMAANGRNRTNYVKVEYATTHKQLGTLNAYYRGELVYDSIEEPVYQIVIDPLARQAQNVAIEIRPDQLLMRNSRVHTLFLKTSFTGIHGMNVINKLRYQLNDRQRDTFEDGTLQSGANIINLALVSKADYTWTVGDLTVAPMAKFMMEQQRASDQVALSRRTYTLFPILRTDYRFSPNTLAKVGIQGLPGFRHRFRNLDNHSEDTNATHYIVALQNRSNYRGYGLTISLGYRSSRIESPELPEERVRRFKEFFMQAWIE